MAIPTKKVKDLHEAAQRLNTARSRVRQLSGITKGLPRFEYDTTSKLPTRPTRSLLRHPTKKVKRSHKREAIELVQTAANIELYNAQNAFDKAYEKVYGK
jgi:hypothetical protein